jgi:CRISPR-associated protein Cmr1
LRVELKPLTPLWTGDSNGVSDHLRPTGLLGSMRWWFEAIVRASGYYACDPTAGGCLYQNEKSVLCGACKLFGTTGWARRFRLTASGLAPEPWYLLANPAVARMHEGWLKRILTPKPQSPEPKVLWGENLVLEFHRYLSRMPDAEWDLFQRVLRSLLVIIAKYGALGAKAQNGFGAVSFSNPSVEYRGSLREFLVTSQDGRHADEKWFDLSRTIFLEFEVFDPGIYAKSAVRIGSPGRSRYEDRVLPIAYDIRFKSQSKHFRTGAGEDVGVRPLLKTFLTGRVGDIEDIVGSSARSSDRTASRVFVTHLYRTGTSEKYRFRIWVHVPGDARITPKEVGAKIQEYVVRRMFRGSKGTMLDWNAVKKEL